MIKIKYNKWYDRITGRLRDWRELNRSCNFVAPGNPNATTLRQSSRAQLCCAREVERNYVAPGKSNTTMLHQLGIRRPTTLPTPASYTRTEWSINGQSDISNKRAQCRAPLREICSFARSHGEKHTHSCIPRGGSSRRRALIWDSTLTLLHTRLEPIARRIDHINHPININRRTHSMNRFFLVCTCAEYFDTSIFGRCFGKQTPSRKLEDDSGYSTYKHNGA